MGNVCARRHVLACVTHLKVVSLAAQVATGVLLASVSRFVTAVDECISPARTHMLCLRLPAQQTNHRDVVAVRAEAGAISHQSLASVSPCTM